MRPDITVIDYMSHYVDTLETSRSVERTTIRGYRCDVGYADEGLCGIAMRDLTTEDVQAWEADLMGPERGLSPKTVRKAHVLLKTVCEEAIEDGLLDRNPVARVRAPKVARTMPNALPDDQRRTLLAYLEAAADTPFNLAVTIALMTGMRQGEICALRWGDVDFDARTVWVRRAIARDGGRTYVKEPKTASGRRDVPMAEALVGPLRHRYREMRAERLEADLDDYPRAHGAALRAGRRPRGICERPSPSGSSGTRSRARWGSWARRAGYPRSTTSGTRSPPSPSPRAWT